MTDPYIRLLETMISTPSFSRDEGRCADILESFLNAQGVRPDRMGNCIWCMADGYSENRPTLLLNSHIDTVRPVSSWVRDPFVPVIEDGKLFGLGSNDAGASVVSLVRTFVGCRKMKFPFNLLLAVTAEEEVMGEGGMRMFLAEMKSRGIGIDMAVVGEPTGLQPAVGERGLVVLDCVTKGISGHAARNEGVNAIYKAIADIETLRDFRFGLESGLLGPVKISVTQIEAGTQHNVVPDVCRWVADVRTTDAYSNEEVVEILRKAVTSSELTPRSTRIRASAIAASHPLVEAAVRAGGRPYVSPTTSDMALMPDISSLKIGPGESSRSHRADEFIRIDELFNAFEFYPLLLNNLSDILS